MSKDDIPVAVYGAYIGWVQLGATVHVRGGGAGGGNGAPVAPHVALRDPNPAHLHIITNEEKS